MRVERNRLIITDEQTEFNFDVPIHLSPMTVKLWARKFEFRVLRSFKLASGMMKCH
jgi:hypothetical protein